MRLDLGDPAWTRFVGSSTEALPYHLPAWTRLLARSYKHRPFVQAVLHEGTVVAGLPLVDVKLPLRPRAWVALPFTDYCPPLGDNREARERLLRELDDARRRENVPRLEVRADVETPGLSPVSQGVRHELQLEADPDAVFRRFHRSQVQRNIRRAEREGVVARLATSLEDLTDVFYDLHLTTRRRQGTPIQPRRFFRFLWEEIVEPGHAFVVLAEIAGTAVAAAVFLHSHRTVIYKYGASHQDAWTVRPNHAIFWSAIRWSCERGYARFDFGRTDSGDEGLAAFKRSWGAEELPLVYATAGQRGAGVATDTGRAGAMLATVIRRSPRFVCRATGELLYRFAA